MSDIKDEIESLFARIDEISGNYPTNTEDISLVEQKLLLNLEASRMLLNAMSSTVMGECRREHPYKPLRPIIDEDGKFKWCCTHTPPHCSGE